MKKIVAAIGIVALVAGNGFAQNRIAKKEAISGQEVQMKKERQRGMEENLPDLTEAQKTEIQKIKAEHRKNSETQHKEVRELRNKLAELKRAENPDHNKINTLIDKTAKLDAEITKSKTAAQLKVRSVLTAEQRTALDAQQKERMEMRSQRHKERKEMHNAK